MGFADAVLRLDKAALSRFGEVDTVTYTPAGGSALPVAGVFFNPAEREEPGELSFEGNQPAVYVIWNRTVGGDFQIWDGTAFLTPGQDLAQGDEFSIRNEDYQVSEVMRDDGNILRCRLMVDDISK